MTFSSAEEAIVRGSPPPHLSPARASAIHPATQALSHTLAGNEEAEPLLRSSSSHTTPLSSQRNTPQPPSSLTAPQPSASPPTPPSVPPKKRRHAWTSEQDALLVALVKQHGPRWVRIVAELNKSGGSQRNAVGALKRHARLMDRQSSTASSSSSGLAPSSFSSSSAPQQRQQHQQQHRHHQQRAQQSPTLPAATQRSSRKGCKPKRWTSEEYAVLAAVSQTYEKQCQIYRAFKEALPGTERTEWAVLARWNQTYHRGRMAGGEDGVGGGGGIGDERTEAAAVAPVGSAGGAAMVADRVEAATYGCPYEEAEGTVSAWPLSPSVAQDLTIKTSEAAPPSTTFVSASASTPPQLNYTIEYLWNGFLVRNFPPYHELRIHSPTSCQVIEPDAQPASLNSEPEEEQTPAPFVFTVEASGFVQALTLPAGTKTSITILDVGDEDDSGEEGGQAKVVKARFEGKDGYIVVFQNELSS